MRRGDAFPSRYLGQTDLERPTTATIADVRKEEVQGEHGTEDKAVMFFMEEDIKPMILNHTNWTACEDAYGEDTEDWTGKPIELYVDPGVMFGKKKVGGVRVRIRSGGHKAKVAVTSERWTWVRAQEEAEAAGIDLETLKANLKELGHESWKPSRDTAAVKEMIADMERLTTPDGDDDIPF